MKVVGHIFRVSSPKLGNIGNHDVLVLRHDRKSGECVVKTITSMEHEHVDPRTHAKVMRYDFKALDQARRGIVFPVPKKVLGSRHWSAIHNNPYVVKDTELQPRRVCKKDEVSWKYLKVVWH